MVATDSLSNDFLTRLSPTTSRLHAIGTTKQLTDWLRVHSMKAVVSGGLAGVSYSTAIAVCRSITVSLWQKPCCSDLISPCIIQRLHALAGCILRRSTVESIQSNRKAPVQILSLTTSLGGLSVIDDARRPCGASHQLNGVTWQLTPDASTALVASRQEFNNPAAAVAVIIQLCVSANES